MQTNYYTQIDDLFAELDTEKKWIHRWPADPEPVVPEPVHFEEELIPEEKSEEVKVIEPQEIIIEQQPAVLMGKVYSNSQNSRSSCLKKQAESASQKQSSGEESSPEADDEHSSDNSMSDDHFFEVEQTGNLDEKIRASLHQTQLHNLNEMFPSEEAISPNVSADVHTEAKFSRDEEEDPAQENSIHL